MGERTLFLKRRDGSGGRRVFPRLEAKLASKEIPFSAGLISSITLFSEPAWVISVFFGVLFVDAPGVIRMWLKGWKEKRPPADFVAVE